MARKSVQVSRKLFVDQEFFTFLLNSNNLIGSILLNLDLGDDISYIAPTEHDDKVSYLPTEKFSDGVDFDPYGKKVGRVTSKVGKFVRKMIPQEMLEKYDVNNQEIEKFVNLYKSWFDSSNFILKVVEGEEIRKWYNEDSYYAPNGNRIGSLWNSCMRYEARMRFLDLYCKNSNIKMLVMLHQDGETIKVRSRALLWDGVKVTKDFSGNLPNEIKVMDRIYSVFDSDVNIFKKWAFENGYTPKWEQNAKSHQFFDIKGEVVRARCSFQLDNWRLSYYPYLDTLPYFNYDNGMISNDEYSFSWDYKLVQATGNLEPERQHEDDEEENNDW
jgi:hypothetical protein